MKKKPDLVELLETVGGLLALLTICAIGLKQCGVY